MVQISISRSTRRGTSPRPSGPPSPWSPRRTPNRAKPPRPANDPMQPPDPANDNDPPGTPPGRRRRPPLRPYVPPHIRRLNLQRLNRWQNAWDAYNDGRSSLEAISSVFTRFNYAVNAGLNCGPGVQAMNAAWTACGPELAVANSAGRRVNTNTTPVFVWGPIVRPHNVVDFSWRARGIRYDRGTGYARAAQSPAWNYGPLGRWSVQPRTQPQPLPGEPQVPVTPRPLNPHVNPNPNPGGNPVGRYSPNQGYDAEPRPNQWDRRVAGVRQFPRTEPHVDRPSPPGDRERKVRVPRQIMWLLHRAHDISEGLDFLEALYDALPKQYRTSFSGRTRNNARIGANKPYATPFDKARDLYRNWDKVDLPLAIKNIAKNAVEDAVLGRLNSGSDRFSNRNLGGRRLVLT